jgi:hypothetical protein
MWAAIINIILGLWVMIAPAILNYEQEVANKSYIIGPIVITFAITAIWEVNRSLRFANIPLGLWLAASPFLLSYDGMPLYNDLLTGAGIIAFSLVKGNITGRYGGGWLSLFRSNPEHIQQQNTYQKSST